MSTEPRLALPAGYGFSLLPRVSWSSSDLDSLMDRLLIAEPPVRGAQYIMAADIGDGLGQDRSVADILRVGTVTEPDKQVAQFVTSSMDAVDFASILDALGRFYTDIDGLEALAAIECNGHGLATQAELQRHYGYSNFFVWQYEDARDPRSRYSRRIGWYTTSRTRPIILSRLIKALKTYVEPDPEHPGLTRRTKYPELVVFSPHTWVELQDFQTEGALWQAEAAPGAHDDTLMTLAIAVHVAQTLHFEDREPLSEQRHRLMEERENRDALAARLETRRDWANTDATVEEMRDGFVEPMGVLDADW